MLCSFNGAWGTNLPPLIMYHKIDSSNLMFVAGAKMYSMLIVYLRNPKKKEVNFGLINVLVDTLCYYDCDLVYSRYYVVGQRSLF